ncbi:MAG: metallophosphoesterase N-terminal domain-containing protein, partial [Mobilicoccus sp.]|nr:metallophosphoesterase N-terminal domain-containing protein [Mobilicoccus sp.]
MAVRRLHTAVAPALVTLLGATGAAYAAAPTTTAAPAAAPSIAEATAKTVGWSDDRYVGGVEVVRGPAGMRAQSGGQTITGHVFVDSNQNSRMDRREKGLAGVRVSNGRDIVTTDRRGRYTLPAFENMTVTITQPAGYQVPVDENNVAQFHYNHLPAGSPGEYRFGGLEPTGPLPSALNFPLVKSKASAAKEQSCVMAGDLQTYSVREIAYGRDGALKDLSDRGPLSACGALFLGDVAGDDLGLYPQMKDAVGIVNGPIRFLPGNHDLDFDATDPLHAFDTFRQHMGPAYFSYDVGDTHVIALNTVRYPCDETDNADGNRPQCVGDNPAYNGRIDDDQMAWLKADIEGTPKDKLIVLAAHIGLMNF